MSSMDYAEVYTALHRKRDTIFSGRSVLPHVKSIRELVIQHNPKTLIDYGCGKGLQYSLDKVQRQWYNKMPLLYDIGVPKYSARPVPVGTVGIICTDVLEHIQEEDLPAILTDIYSFKPVFAFFSISCKPAKKTFKDGRNMHLTIKSPLWWADFIKPYKNEDCHNRVAYTGVTNEDH